MPRTYGIKVGSPRSAGYTPKYPGDPGPGVYYAGFAEPATRATGQSQSNNKLSVYHTYAGNANPSVSDLDKAYDFGMIPSHTFKLAQTPSQVLMGNADAAIDSFAAACIARAPRPIWLCYFHEPEDNFTTSTDKTNYRAAYRRIVQRFRDAGVTNVAWMPIFMCPWTFQTASGRDWKTWHADWTGSGWQSDIMMDIMGLDTYCPVPGSGNSYLSFQTMMEEAKADFTSAGAPDWDIVVPEFGMNNGTGTPPTWSTWCTDAKNYALSSNIKAFIYWPNFDEYSFSATGDPNGTKLAAWRDVIAAGASMYTGP